MTREHNDHQQVTDEKVEVLKLRTTLKRRAEISQGTLKQIFDEEANSSRVGGQVSFVHLESSMYKRRKLNRPNIPQDAEDAISLLNDSSNEYKQYLTFTINEPENGEFALGFMSPSWSTTLQVNSESLLQADATFYVVPNQFYQLLNIFLQYKSYTLPAVHILMSRKTSVLYSKIVEKFKEIFQFTVSGIVTDFEEALFQSFSNGFPGAVASGCLFHYKKATYKTGILRNGLANLYYSNQEFKSWFQQLMNLPLLPSDKIIETYYLLKDSVPELLHSDKKKITVFFTYYERYWLRKIGPMRLSVFRNEKRTTNDLESFHANLKRKFKSHNPNFWDFIKKLNDVILSSEKDMERINNHLPIRRNSIKPLTLQRKFNEEILRNRLLIGEITPLNYLKSISTDYQLEFQTLDYSTFRVDTNESEVETEGQSGEETNSQFICTDAAEAGPRSCRVCLVTKADTIIFPCRHAQICYSCAENLVTTNGCKQCPICRGTIQQYFHIFL